jgi:GH15 family glucan-1,4-alpha-glucosidase
LTTCIEDYALIGDCETAALVSRDGSIDWLCWPRFDSDACFAALLGTAEHGRWLLTSQERNVRISRSYRTQTLILETVYESDHSRVRVIDFMPPRGRASDVVRLVVGERGEMSMHTELVVRFGYGAHIPWVSRGDDDLWRAVAGPDMLVLRSEIRLQGRSMRSVADFTVKAGESISFVLTYAPSHEAVPHAFDVQQSLRDTEVSWRQWVARGNPASRHSEAVIRSLITLRALVYRPTGGMVAAPTTSLPERIGGVRNWDYRFCWLRDATLTLLSFMNAGFYEEAGAWRSWLTRAVAGSPQQLQIMYGIGGERRLTELELPWLPGYERSTPVRIGNLAHEQLQLDVFGEVMDALHQARVGGVQADDTSWNVQCALLEHLESIWEQPDFGMWEMRGPARHFTYSKVMCWLAFDRGIKSAEQFALQGPVARWRELRGRIHAQVCERGFDTQQNCFVQSYGSTELDASLLLLPTVGFLPADDSRVLGTIAAVEEHLLRDGLVARYKTAQADDGLPQGEGMFLACSFWLCDAYVITGRRAEATAMFERLLTLRNDVGLLAEEYDPQAARQLGNFPQAFSHVALITTAFNLTRDEKPAQQRSNGHAQVAPPTEQ